MKQIPQKLIMMKEINKKMKKEKKFNDIKQTINQKTKQHKKANYNLEENNCKKRNCINISTKIIIIK